MKLHNINKSSLADDLPIAIFPVLFADKQGTWYAGHYMSDSVAEECRGWYANTPKHNTDGIRVHDVVSWAYIDDIIEEKGI